MSGQSNYQNKIRLVKDLLTEHNNQLNPSLWVDVSKIMLSLSIAGGTTDYALTKCTWEDLQEIGFPKLLARQVADIFRHNG